MTNKTRKHIWPVGLLAALAVVGLLAAVVVLASNPGGAMAHGGGDDHAASCEAMTESQRDRHNAAVDQFGGETCADLTPALAAPANVTADAGERRALAISWDAVEGATNYRITWDPRNSRGVSEALSSQTTYTIESLEPDSSYTVRVMALHESDADLNSAPTTITAQTAPVSYSLMFSDHEDGAPNRRVIVGGAETIVTTTIGTDSSQETTVNVRIAGADGTMHYLGTAAPDPLTEAGVIYMTSGLKAGAGQRTIDDGSFDVRARDDSARAFEIHVTCVTPAGVPHQGVLEVEVRNEDTDVVAEGTITCEAPPEPPPPDDTIGEAECFSVTGMPDEMRDDALATAANAEMGQGTVEVLYGTDDVQITVTSCQEGPVYIRFLDADGVVFGTDVDECDDPCVDAAGADVTGLSSGQKLELNLTNELDAAKALAYGQYSVVTRGDGTGQYLQGNAGTYYQGKFRVHDPCELRPAGDFHVEVYEKDEKTMMVSEHVMCVGAPRPGPTGLTFTIDSEKPGEGTLEYHPADNATSHTVLLVDAENRSVVEEREDADLTETFTNLNTGWTYHLIVIAQTQHDKFTADAVTARVQWLGMDDVPLNMAPEPTATGMHNLCQTEQHDVMDLLADCDTDLGEPDIISFSVGNGSATVNWTDGASARGHLVLLLDGDFEMVGIDAEPTGNTVTFDDLSAGIYTVVVVSYNADGYLYKTETRTIQ